MAKAPSPTALLNRYAVAAIRSRKLSGTMALKLKDICDHSRLKAPEHLGGVEGVILQKIKSANCMYEMLIKHMAAPQESRRPLEIKFFEEFVSILELGIYPIIEASIGYRTLYAGKEENPENNRRFCLEHFEVTRRLLSMFETIKADKKIVTEGKSDTAFKQQMEAFCIQMQGYRDRAGEEIAMPAFRVDRQTLMTWHEEILKCVATLTIECPLTHVGLRANPPQKEDANAQQNQAFEPMSDLSKHYADYLIEFGRFLSTMHVGLSKVEDSYSLTAKEGLTDHIRFNLLSMNEALDRATMAFAGKTWQDADMEAMQHHLLLNQERMLPWSWFGVFRSSAMYGSKEDDLALNKKYCVDYVQYASDLMNRIDTLCSRPKLAPVTGTTDQFRMNAAAIRELVAKEVDWATVEICKPVVTIPRIDLSKTYDALIALTQRYTKEVAGALKYDPAAPAITLATVAPLKIEKAAAIPESKNETIPQAVPETIIH